MNKPPDQIRVTASDAQQAVQLAEKVRSLVMALL
jgi:hypothetical protein